MTKHTEALKMADISFMQMNERYPRRDNGDGYFDAEIKACKEALERPTNMVAVPADQLEKMQQELKQLRKQPAQSPVAWCDSLVAPKAFATNIQQRCTVPLYIHPAPSWQGLSDDEINKIVQTVSDDMYPWKGNMLIGKIIRAIEQALKEKNNG